MVDQPNILIIEAPYYEDICAELIRGATTVLDDRGATHERIEVPGAFEIPAAIAMAVRALDFYAGRRRFDGFIALGCVIRGETSHYDYVCNESARALQDLACRYSLAIGYGILTVNNREQALERAAVDRRDKGGEAARACMQMLDVKRQFNLYPR